MSEGKNRQSLLLPILMPIRVRSVLATIATLAAGRFRTASKSAKATRSSAKSS